MVRPQLLQHFIGGDGACLIRLHSVLDRHNLILQPALNHGIALLQGAQALADDLACGGVKAAGHLGVDVSHLVGRQADGSLLDVGQNGLYATGVKISYHIFVSSQAPLPLVNHGGVTARCGTTAGRVPCTPGPI